LGIFVYLSANCTLGLNPHFVSEHLPSCRKRGKEKQKKSCAKKGRLDPTLSIRKGMEDVSIHYHGQNVPTWFCSLPSPEMFNSEREMEFLNNSNRDLNPNALNEV
jgi:hypothetical protein